MRPKMKCRDYVFGISPSNTNPRRILFAAKIEDRITFKDAYERFPALHGPQGPIHICPVQGTGFFPTSKYRHIPGSIHEKDWQSDLAIPELDAFFVCSKQDNWQGRWLGVHGPEIDDQILSFLKKCSIYGAKGLLSNQNIDATLRTPIAYGGLYRGLHLETSQPEALLALMGTRMGAKPTDLDYLKVPKPSSRQSGGSGGGKSYRKCGC